MRDSCVWRGSRYLGIEKQLSEKDMKTGGYMSQPVVVDVLLTDFNQ
jgi:hypothetical protein